MKKKRICMCCFNSAKYISHNSSLALCEDCYTDMSDTYADSFEEEYGVPFDEYYDIEEIEE